MLIFFPRIRTVGRWAVPRRPAPNPAIATVGTKEKAAHQTGEPLSLAVSIKLYAWAFLSPVVSPPFSLHYYIICVPHFIYFLRQSPSIFEHICLNGTHPKSRLSLETARLSPQNKDRILWDCDGSPCAGPMPEADLLSIHKNGIAHRFDCLARKSNYTFNV